MLRCWAALTLAAAGARWMVAVDQTAPPECGDAFVGFRKELNLTAEVDVAGQIKSTVINHLLYKLLTDRFRWKARASRAAYADSSGVTYAADVLHNDPKPALAAATPTSEPTAAPDRQQEYDNDKLMGRQTLDRLRTAIQAYFDHTGLLSAIWSSASRGVSAAEAGPRGVGSGSDYFNSDYAENLLDQIIGEASFSIFPNISLSVDSAMINLGAALCRTSEISQDSVPAAFLDQYTCATQALLEQGLKCNARDISVDCSKPSILPDVADPATICNVPEVGKQDPSSGFCFLPTIHATPNNVTTAQGNVDRWLLNAVSTLYQYTKYDAFCGGTLPESTMLPGWKVISDIWLDYSKIRNLNQTQAAAPFSVVLKRGESCDFVVVNRGSVYRSDWLIDFDYSLVPLIYTPEVFGPPPNATHVSSDAEHLGSLSKGYAEVAIESTKAIFADFNNAGCPVPSTITFTGHSMGGIIGAAQALLLSSLYRKAPVLNLIAFGAPSAIDETFRALIDERATVRAWTMELDAVTNIPCENSLPLCGHTATSAADRPRISHSSLPNSITISNDLLASVMPTMGQKSFGTISYNVFSGDLDLSQITFPGPTLFAQAHTCAYACWFNAVYCSADSASDICTACIGQ